jgi:hypothetical protein
MQQLATDDAAPGPVRSGAVAGQAHNGSVGVRRILLALGTLAGLVALAVAAAGHVGPLPL